MVLFGVLEISRGTLCKLYDCLTTKLCPQNQYIIKNSITVLDTLDLLCKVISITLIIFDRNGNDCRQKNYISFENYSIFL